MDSQFVTDIKYKYLISLCDIICNRHSNKYTFLFFNQKSTICVQIFNDSQNLTIHIIYRILPRSYSIKKPRYPLLKVVFFI